MKNKIYYLGLATLMLITAGAISKIMHWPGAGIALTLGISLLVIAFIPAALISSFRNESSGRYKFLYILIGVVFIIDFAGMLFKLMHWPGAGLFIIVSLPLPFIVVLPAYLIAIKDDKELNYKNLIAILFFFAYFAAISGLMAMGVSRNVIDGYMHSTVSIEKKTNEINQECMIRYSELLQGNTYDSATLACIKQVVKHSDKVCSDIDNLTRELLGKQPEKRDGFNTEAFIRNIKYKDASFNYDLNNSVIILKSEIDELIASINKVNIKNNPSELIRLFVYENDKGPEFYKYNLLQNKIVVSGIERLNLIKHQVRLAQLEVLYE